MNVNNACIYAQCAYHEIIETAILRREKWRAIANMAFLAVIAAALNRQAGFAIPAKRFMRAACLETGHWMAELFAMRLITKKQKQDSRRHAPMQSRKEWI
jgi:hypothetical protein